MPRSIRLVFFVCAVGFVGCAGIPGMTGPAEVDAPCFPTSEVSSDSMGEASVDEDPPILVGGIRGLVNRTRYPTEARYKDLEGTVCLQFVVNAEGGVEDITVIRSVHPLLDASVIRAVQASTFRPGRRNGEPVASTFGLPVRFKIKGGSNTERMLASTGAVVLVGVAIYFLLAVPAD